MLWGAFATAVCVADHPAEAYDTSPVSLQHGHSELQCDHVDHDEVLGQFTVQFWWTHENRESSCNFHHHRPPSWPFGTGLIQATRTLAPIVMAPISQNTLP